VAAPFVAWRLARGAGRRSAVWFNVLGILDLVVALSIGVLTGLGPNQLIAASPSTAAVTVLPLVLIPTTVVPLAIALHVVSLRRLRASYRSPGSVPPLSEVTAGSTTRVPASASSTAAEPSGAARAPGP
jgi:hypothetical protein